MSVEWSRRAARDGTFEPQLVRQHQWRFTGFDAKILSVYARGMSVRDQGTGQHKAVYLAWGVRVDGVKEVRGLWIAPQEGAKFWLTVLTERKTRTGSRGRDDQPKY